MKQSTKLRRHHTRAGYVCRAGFVLLALGLLSLAACHAFFTNPTLSSILVTPANPNLVVGTTQQFRATGVNSDGSSGGTLTATWTSSTPSAATITSSGLATAVATGTTTITASSGSLTGSTTATVNNSALQSITIAALSPSLTVNGTDQLTATGTFADGSTRNISASATWQSSNRAIATVSTSGLVVGVSVGTVTITASSGNVSGQINLQVLGTL